MMLAIFIISLASMATAQSGHCYYTDPLQPQRAMFSTITAFDSIRGNQLSLQLSTCTPARLWMLSRGGSRLPDDIQINTMRTFSQAVFPRVLSSINAGRSQLCDPDANNLRFWAFNTSITPDRSLELAQTGWTEIRNLAMRLQARFPQVLPRTYNPAQFRFRHTDRERTADSALAYADGLFGHQNVVLEEGVSPDRLLRPIDSCRLYDQWASNNVERDAFRAGPEFNLMMTQVNTRLGLSGAEALSASEILTLTDLCRFEQNWWPTMNSAWCGPLTVVNHDVLSFSDDLSTFQTSGYGGDEALFRNINCRAMQELLQFLQSTNPNEHLARIHISHSAVIRLFLVTLGVFRDNVPLNRNNFPQQAGRLWNSSRISSMATNLVIVQHTCASGDNDIVVFYNERPLAIPGCEQAGLCKQSTFFRLFERFVSANCDQLYCSRN